MTTKDHEKRADDLVRAVNHLKRTGAELEALDKEGTEVKLIMCRQGHHDLKMYLDFPERQQFQILARRYLVRRHETAKESVKEAAELINEPLTPTEQ